MKILKLLIISIFILNGCSSSKTEEPKQKVVSVVKKQQKIIQTNTTYNDLVVLRYKMVKPIRKYIGLSTSSKGAYDSTGNPGYFAESQYWTDSINHSDLTKLKAGYSSLCAKLKGDYAQGECLSKNGKHILFYANYSISGNALISTHMAPEKRVWNLEYAPIKNKFKKWENKSKQEIINHPKKTTTGFSKKNDARLAASGRTPNKSVNTEKNQAEVCAMITTFIGDITKQRDAGIDYKNLEKNQHLYKIEPTKGMNIGVLIMNAVDNTSYLKANLVSRGFLYTCGFTNNNLMLSPNDFRKFERCNSLANNDNAMDSCVRKILGVSKK